MLAKLVEKRKEFEAKQDKLHNVFKEAGKEMDFSKVTVLDGDDKAKVEAVRKMNLELDALGKEIEELVGLENIAKADETREKGLEAMGGVSLPAPIIKEAKPKSIGEMFVESKAFKDYHGGPQGPVGTLDIDLKTVFATTAGWAPETIRTGLMVPIATRPIKVVDIIPSGRTDDTAIVYMEETTFTNVAVEVAEAGAKPEATLALTERSSPVRKIAVWIPVTSEQLEDVAGIQSYLNNRLTLMIRQRLDLQLLVGNGVAPNLMGLNNVVGVQTFVLAGDQFDAIYQAIKQVRTIGFAEADNVVMHPNDWQQLRLARTDTGLYILGNPSEPGPFRIWGLPVLESTAQTENTVLTGDFAGYCQLFEKKGIDIQISDSHDTYFIYNKLAVRCEIRVAFPIYRPAAFCTVSGF